MKPKCLDPEDASAGALVAVYDTQFTESCDGMIIGKKEFAKFGRTGGFRVTVMLFDASVRTFFLYAKEKRMVSLT